MKAIVHIFSNLRVQLIIVLLTLSLIPITVFGVFSFRTMIGQVEAQKEKSLTAYAQSAANTVDAKITSVGNLLDGLSAHADIRLLLENFNRHSETFDTTRINSVTYSFKNMVDSSEGLYETIFLTGLDGIIILDGSKYSSFYQGKKFYDKNDYDKLIKNGQMVVGKPLKSEATGKLLIPVSRPIGMITSSQKNPSSIMGIITVLYDLDKFNESFKNGTTGENGQLIIISSNNTVLYNKDIDKINTKIEEITYSDDKTDGNSFTYSDASGEKIAWRQKAENVDWNVIVQMDSKEYFNEKKSFTIFIWVTIIAIFAAAITAAVVYSRYLTKPILTLIEKMEKTQKGDLKTYSNEPFKILEMRKLHKGFNIMIENLALIISEVKETSNSVYASAKEMSAITQTSLVHAEETVSAVENINVGIGQQSDSTALAHKDIDELSNMVDIAKELSGDIRGNSGQVLKAVENGMLASNMLEKKWYDNKKSMEQVASSINTLTEDITDINKIASTISQITKQTRLLSLNAAIEASRAGDSGKGFGVVAEEIKKLSENTHNEVKDIDRIISVIMERTEKLIQSMKEAEISEEAQNKSVMATKDSLVNIYSHIKDIDDKINNIASYLENVSLRKNEITSLVFEIKKVSDQVLKESALIDEYVRIQEEALKRVNIEADGLSDSSTRLMDTTVRFKV